MNLLSHHVVNMKIFLNITIQDVLSPSVCPMPPYTWNPRKSVHTFTKRDMPHSRINQQKDTHWRAPQRTATHCNTFTHSRTIRRTRSGCATTHHNALQRTSTHWATHCHALQHTATHSLVHEKSEGHALTRTTTHCNTLQHIVHTGNTLQHRNASHWNTLQHTHSSTNHQDDTYCMHCNTLQRTATHCNTGLQRTATHCNALQRTATHSLVHEPSAGHAWTAMHCNALQHTATHCNTQQHTHSFTNNQEDTHCMHRRGALRFWIPLCGARSSTDLSLISSSMIVLAQVCIDFSYCKYCTFANTLSVRFPNYTKVPQLYSK